MNLNQSEAGRAPAGQLNSFQLNDWHSRMHRDQADLHRRLARAVGVSAEKVSNALWVERMQLLELQGGEL